MRALADNEFEAAARERKATAMARLLFALGVPASVAAVANKDARHAVAVKADQRDPSDETWARVVELVDAYENLRDLPPPAGSPFEGLDSGGAVS